VKRPAGIRLVGVTKEYPTRSGPVRALDRIDLEVKPGSTLAVMGHSGCGKSTLLGLIGGLEPPSRGQVQVGGVELSGLAESDRCRLRREHIGLVFQSDNLLPYLTALENVLLPLALTPAPAASTGNSPTGNSATGNSATGHPTPESLLADLGLAAFATRLPDQLSGGQRLRVAIARATVHRPAILLADEPTGSLDAGTAEVILDVLLQARRDADATLVLVTHDPVVARRADRTVRLHAGRLLPVDPSDREA
jgi:putative ABC transport system ATP-binding protein